MDLPYERVLTTSAATHCASKGRELVNYNLIGVSYALNIVDGRVTTATIEVPDGIEVIVDQKKLTERVVSGGGSGDYIEVACAGTALALKKQDS